MKVPARNKLRRSNQFNPARLSSITATCALSNQRVFRCLEQVNLTRSLIETARKLSNAFSLGKERSVPNRVYNNHENHTYLILEDRSSFFDKKVIKRGNREETMIKTLRAHVLTFFLVRRCALN